jgi:hypothetical protein
MLSQKSIIFIWIKGVIVRRYRDGQDRTTTREGSINFLRSLIYHDAIQQGKCRVVLVTAKPRKNIVHQINRIIGTSISETPMNLLTREDIIKNDIMMPVDGWVNVYNNRHGTTYTHKDLLVIDCNDIDSSGRYTNYGRKAGPQYSSCTILIRPILSDIRTTRDLRKKKIKSWDECGLNNPSNMKDLQSIVLGHLNETLNCSQLPSTVFSVIKHVLDD